MKEINNIMEQPENISSDAQGAAAQIDDNGAKTECEGSIGKFKDSASLMQAYNNLQSEFTKKCQALSSLQNVIADNKQNLPDFYDTNWQSKVDEFLNDNPEAKQYSDSISKMILSDKTIGMSDNPLESAWNKIVKENFKSPQSLVEDENFINNYIVNNKIIKEKILNDYFNQVNFEKSPTLIATNSGAASVLTPKQKPKNIAEAGQLAKALFD